MVHKTYPGGKEQFNKDRKEKEDKVLLLEDTMIAICENAGTGFVKDAIEVLWEDLTPEQQKEFAKEHAGELILFEYWLDYHGLEFEPELTKEGATAEAGEDITKAAIAGGLCLCSQTTSGRRGAKIHVSRRSREVLRRAAVHCLCVRCAAVHSLCVDAL
jgi:hypothetical protein